MVRAFFFFSLFAGFYPLAGAPPIREIPLGGEGNSYEENRDIWHALNVQNHIYDRKDPRDMIRVIYFNNLLSEAKTRLDSHNQAVEDFRSGKLLKVPSYELPDFEAKLNHFDRRVGDGAKAFGPTREFDDILDTLWSVSPKAAKLLSQRYMNREFNASYPTVRTDNYLIALQEEADKSLRDIYEMSAKGPWKAKAIRAEDGQTPVYGERLLPISAAVDREFAAGSFSLNASLKDSAVFKERLNREKIESELERLVKADRPGSQDIQRSREKLEAIEKGSSDPKVKQRAAAVRKVLELRERIHLLAEKAQNEGLTDGEKEELRAAGKAAAHELLQHAHRVVQQDIGAAVEFRRMPALTEAQRKEIEEITDRSLTRAFGGLSLVFHRADPDWGRAVGGIGNGVSSVRSAILDFQKLQNNGADSVAKGFAMAGVYGAFLGAAISLMDSGKPDVMALIYEQVKLMREELQETREEMREGLQRINVALDQMYNDIMPQLWRIERGQERQTVDIHTVQQALIAVQKRQAHTDFDIKQYFEAIADQNRNKDATKCLKIAGYIKVGRLNEKFPEILVNDFKECLISITDCVTEDAKNAIYAGAGKSPGSEAELLSMALNNTGVESEIWPLLSSAKAYGLKDSNLGAAQFNGDRRFGPANINRLSACVRMYIQTARAFPDLYKQYVQEESEAQGQDSIAVMVRTLKNTQEHLSGISSTFDDANPGKSLPNTEMFKLLLQNYVLSMKATAVELHQLRNRLRVDPMAPLDKIQAGALVLHGYDPLLGVGQKLPDPKVFPKAESPAFIKGTFVPNRAGICDMKAMWYAEHAKYGDRNTFQSMLGTQANLPKEFPLDEKVKDLIPAAFSMAAELGLGEVKICVGTATGRDNVSRPIAAWTDPVRSPAETNVIGDWHHVPLKGVFVDKASKKELPLFHLDVRVDRGDMENWRKDSNKSELEKKVEGIAQGFAFDNELRALPFLAAARHATRTSKEMVTPAEKIESLKQVKESIRQTLAAGAERLSSYLARDITSGSLAKTTGPLDLNRDRLQAMLMLGFRSAMDNDVVLSSLLRGSQSLPHSADFAAAYLRQRAPAFEKAALAEKPDLLEPSLAVQSVLDLTAAEEEMKQAQEEIDCVLTGYDGKATLEDLAPQYKRLHEALGAHGEEFAWLDIYLPYLESKGLLSEENSAFIKDNLGFSDSMLKQLRDEVGAKKLSDDTRLALKLVILNYKLFRELLVDGQVPQWHPELKRSLANLRAFSISVSEPPGAAKE